VHYTTHTPTLFCAHCYCEYCRRAHGAASVTWFGVEESTCQITSTNDALRWYQSSEQSRRGFCGGCGSTLFFASTLCPGELHIALASATTPIDRQPSLNCFVDQRAPWAPIDESLGSLGSGSQQLARYRTVQSRKT
jgi:hypothetical protein